MSRCFPYPPPGYIPSRASNEALIESIKLQKEREKGKSERKKEKKEKRRERKEKKKSKEENKAKQIKTSQLEHSLFEGEFTQKEKKDDTEQLERSSITEEHEQPSQNSSYSSDGTQKNSGCKRKRLDSPMNSTRVQGGNILRFRLPSQKQIKYDVKVEEQQPKQIKHDVRVVEQPVLSSSQKVIKQDTIGGEELPVLRLASQNYRKPKIRGGEDQPSTSGRTDVLVEDKNIFSRTVLDKSCPTSLATVPKAIVDPLRSDRRWIQRNSGGLEHTCLEEVYGVDSSSRRYKKMKKVADKYKTLFENWTPPGMSRDVDNYQGDDWLLGSKNEVTTRPENMSRGGSIDTMVMICCGSSTLWPPRAHYLPEADVYALPYTIPF